MYSCPKAAIFLASEACTAVLIIGAMTRGEDATVSLNLKQLKLFKYKPKYKKTTCQVNDVVEEKTFEVQVKFTE